jgi:hypothetical protein
MKTKNDPDLRVSGIDGKCNKAPYQTPALRVYGAVSQLTAGGGGSMTDGANTMHWK